MFYSLKVNTQPFLETINNFYARKMKQVFNITVFVVLQCNFACKEISDSNPIPECVDSLNADCPNFDPCLNESPTIADFKMLGQMGTLPPYDELFLEDTVFFGGVVKFEAVNKTNDYYKWILGADTLEGENMHTVIRTLFVPLQPGIYDAQLYVEKKADSICYPNDPGVDNQKRYFIFHWNICKAEIVNRFRGVYESAPTDTVEIELINAFNGKEICSDMNDGVIHAVNFFGQNDTLNVNRSIQGFANKKVIWNWSNDERLIGEIFIDESQVVHADYTFQGKTRKFKGNIKN